jgi:hypothetical protein
MCDVALHLCSAFCKRVYFVRPGYGCFRRLRVCGLLMKILLDIPAQTTHVAAYSCSISFTNRCAIIIRGNSLIRSVSVSFSSIVKVR